MGELPRVLTAASGLIGLAIGILVLFRGSRRKVSSLFFLMTVFTALWSLSEAMALAAGSLGDKIFWNKLQGVGELLLVPTYLLLALYFPEAKGAMRDRKKAALITALLYAPWAVGLILLYTTDLFYSSYFLEENAAGFDVERTPLFWALTTLGFLVVTTAILIFLRERHRASSPQARRGLLILALAPLPMLVANLIQNMQLNTFITSPQASLIFTCLLAYGILRYGIFIDIRSIAKRTLAHIAVIVFDLAIITLVCAFFYHSLGLGGGFTTYLLFVLTVIPFLLAYNSQVAWVGRFAERLLYVRELEEERLLQQLSRSIRTVRNLEDLARSVVDEVRDSMDLSHCSLMLREESAYRVIGHAYHPDHDARRLGDLAEAGVYLRKAKDFYALEDQSGSYSGYFEIGDRIYRRGYTLDRMGRGMVRIHEGEGAATEIVWCEEEQGETISVPLEVGGEEVGLLWLGEKMGGSPLNLEELDFIAALSTQVAVSLLNSLLLQELLDKSSRLQSLVRMTTTAQEEERMRISRELHDGLVPFFLDIVFKLDLAEAELERSGTPADSLEEVKEKAREGLTVLRQVISDLRPSSLDVLGLEKSLASYLERFGAENGLGVSFHAWGQVGELDSLTEVTIFRVAQEALTNVAHHAGAKSVSLSLGSMDGCLELAVEDDGVGFLTGDLEERIASGQCLGLRGMAERAELIQGSLEIDSEPGSGTRVMLRIPHR